MIWTMSGRESGLHGFLKTFLMRPCRAHVRHTHTYIVSEAATRRACTVSAVCYNTGACGYIPNARMHNRGLAMLLYTPTADILHTPTQTYTQTKHLLLPHTHACTYRTWLSIAYREEWLNMVVLSLRFITLGTCVMDVNRELPSCELAVVGRRVLRTMYAQ